MQSSFTSLTRPELRAHFRTQRRNLSQAEQLCAATDLVAQFSKLAAVRTARSIAFYIANDGELDPRYLIEHCWKEGKAVYLPVLHPFAAGHLAFFQYAESTPMQHNRFGILEPKLDVRAIIKVTELDLIFTPLVAFDNLGNRLGMGGGFYDRTLAKATNSNHTQLVGLAHDCQQASTLTPESWDIPLATIITPTRVIYARS